MQERWTDENLKGKKLDDIAWLLNDMTDRGQHRIEEMQELQETLRDQFAMAALPGLLYRAEFTASHPDLLPLAKDAYVMAEAMLIAREMDLSEGSDQ